MFRNTRNVFIFFLIVFLFGITASCKNPVTTDSSDNNTDSVTPIITRPAGHWLVMVHLAVDNNIDYDFEKNYGYVSNYLQTLESIEASDTNNVVDIVVMMDAYNNDINTIGYTSTFQDGYYHLTGGSFSGDLVISKSEINSGSTADSEAFFDWALTNYPSDYTVYSVFNHGGGFDDANIAGTYGIAFDDNSSDSLSHAELGELTAYIKNATGKKLDLFFPYACLMGGVELAYEVKDNADAMVFSEQTFPADNWSWEGLSGIVSNPAISGTNLAGAICDSAYNYFSQADRDFTLAAVDLSKIDNLYTSLNNFANSAISYLNSNPNEAVWADALAVDGFSMDTAYYTDLKILMQKMIDYGPSNLISYANSVKNALAGSVTDYRCYPSGYDSAGGISIFHNQLNLIDSGYSYSPALYGSILDFGTNSWKDYIQKIADLEPSGDSYEPDYPSTSTTIVVNSAAQSHTFHVGGDRDTMAVSLTASTDYTIQTHPNTTDSDTYLKLIDTDGSTVLAYNDDINFTGGDYYSKINFTPTTDGTYFIVVMDMYVQLGDYTIDVRTGTYSSSSESLSLPPAVDKLPDYRSQKDLNFIPETEETLSYRKY